MAKQVKRRRGTTSEHGAFTGAVGETTVDTDLNTVVVHDGLLAGGYPLAKADLTNADLSNKINVNELATTDGSAGDVLTTDGAGNVTFTSPGGVNPNSVGVTELNTSDGLAGTHLTTNGAGVLSFSAPSVGVDELECADGTAGQVLTTDGAGGISFTTPATGSLTPNSVGITELNTSDGSNGQVLSTDGMGNLSFVTQSGVGGSGSSNFIEDTFSGDGTTDTFTLSTAAPSEESLMAFVDGVSQPTSSYTLPTTTSITFTPAPPNGSAIKVLHLGIASTVADDSVTTIKLANNSVTIEKLAVADGTAGQVLTTNGAGVLSFSNDSTDVGGTAVGGDLSGTVSNITIPNNTITSAMIGNGVIVAQDIATNSINGTHLAMGSDALGDLLRNNGTDFERLPIGTVGQILSVVGGVPTWTSGGALQAAVIGGGGTFSGSTTQTLTGTGFTPTVAILFGSSTSGAGTRWSIGVAGAGGNSNICVGTTDSDNYDATLLYTDRCLMIGDIDTSNGGSGGSTSYTFNAFNNDGAVFNISGHANINVTLQVLFLG